MHLLHSAPCAPNSSLMFECINFHQVHLFSIARLETSTLTARVCFLAAMVASKKPAASKNAAATAAGPPVTTGGSSPSSSFQIASYPPELFPQGTWNEVHGWQYIGPHVSQTFLWPVNKPKPSRSGSRPSKGDKPPKAMKTVKAKKK